MQELNVFLGRQIVLPDADYFPASRAKSPEVTLVSGAIRSKFVAPKYREFVFPRGQPPAMPEVTVHKNSDAFFGKDDIGRTRKRTIV